MKKFIFISVLCLMIGSFVSVSCAQRAGIGVGDKAPDFTLENLDGDKIDIKDAVSSNKAVLLNFFATWCPYCVKEIPELRKLDQKYSKSGLKVIAVNLGESKRKVSSFADRHKIEYAILLDKDNIVGPMFGIRGIPHNILLDGKGIIRYSGTALPPEELLPSD